MEPKFKDETRLKDEYSQLLSKNKELHDMITDICTYCKDAFTKDVVITMIYRSDEEQEAIYKDDPKYKVRKFKSPHQFWHSVDLRSRTFEATEIEKLVSYINGKYNDTNTYKWTARNHDIGLGDHFHLQYCKK